MRHALPGWREWPCCWLPAPRPSRPRSPVSMSGQPTRPAGRSVMWSSPRPSVSWSKPRTRTMCAQKLERQGLKPAAAGQVGRFLVDVTATGTTRKKKFREPIYQYQQIWYPALPRPQTATCFPGYWGAGPVWPAVRGRPAGHAHRAGEPVAAQAARQPGRHPRQAARRVRVHRRLRRRQRGPARSGAVPRARCVRGVFRVRTVAFGC